MNPLEMIDIRQQQMLNNITEIRYSQEQVKELLIKAFAFAKQAYMSGDFIFELESFDSDKVTVDGAVYKVSKMLAEQDKYNIIVQMLDVPEGDMTQSDMAQLSSVMKKAVHNNPNINGVILLPPNYEITLMSAKLNTSDYEIPIEFSDEDINHLVRDKCTSDKWSPKEYSLEPKVPYTDNTVLTDMINQLYQKHFVPNNILFGSSDEEDEDTSNPFWEE
jgi:hypothetical protein